MSLSERVMAFWRWFAVNEERVFHFEKDTEVIFDALAQALSAVHEDVSFEFGPVEAGEVRELVLSASGLTAAMPAVEALSAAAPKSARWRVTKYRPRREPLHLIHLGEQVLDPSTVGFRLFRDGGKVGVMLFIDGYAKERHSEVAPLAYLLVDQALGEHTVLTKVGFIQFRSQRDELFDPTLRATDLGSTFDGAHAQLTSGAPPVLT